jgi:hypothetical protein
MPARAGGHLGFAGRAGTQVEAQKLRGERALASEMALSLSREIAALAEPESLECLADAAGRCMRRGASIAWGCAPATPLPGTSTTCCRCWATRR